MKHTVLTILLSFVVSCLVAQEITLFDSDGKATAYIDASNKTMPIYLWSGEPVAYLYHSQYQNCFSVYGFNGKHLGWFQDGLLIDHQGYIAGFVKGAVNKYTDYEPYKSYKQYLPYKSSPEYEPSKPYRQSYFSTTPLALFLRQ